MSSTSLRKFFRHPLIVTLIGTGAITVAGAWLTNYYQSSQTEANRRFEVFKSELQESYALIDDLNKGMSGRLFSMTQVVWSIKGSTNLSADTLLEDYYKIIKEWNVMALYNKSRIKRLLGNDASAIFMNDSNYYDLGTVHGQFLLAHEKLVELINADQLKYPTHIFEIKLAECEEAIKNTSKSIESFTEACNDSIGYKSIHRTVPSTVGTHKKVPSTEGIG